MPLVCTHRNAPRMHGHGRGRSRQIMPPCDRNGNGLSASACIVGLYFDDGFSRRLPEGGKAASSATDGGGALCENGPQSSGGVMNRRGGLDGGRLPCLGLPRLDRRKKGRKRMSAKSISARNRAARLRANPCITKHLQPLATTCDVKVAQIWVCFAETPTITITVRAITRCKENNDD